MEEGEGPQAGELLGVACVWGPLDLVRGAGQREGGRGF